MQSTQAEITQQNKNNYLISGSVNFSTAPQLLRQTAGLFKTNLQVAAQDLVIDMSQVSDCNSAGLALMLEIVKQARGGNTTVHFENLPDALLTIAKAYGVENEIRDMCITEGVNE